MLSELKAQLTRQSHIYSLQSLNYEQTYNRRYREYIFDQSHQFYNAYRDLIQTQDKIAEDRTFLVFLYRTYPHLIYIPNSTIYSLIRNIQSGERLVTSSENYYFATLDNVLFLTEDFFDMRSNPRNVNFA